MNKRRINLKVAQELRSIGWSHSDIAEYLGCSPDWCRHNVADVEKDYNKMVALADLWLDQPDRG